MLSNQIVNGQSISSQLVNNQPIRTHLIDNQTRTGYNLPESNYFPEANYPYYTQSIESYLPPSSAYGYPMNPGYSSLPLFRSGQLSGQSAFKVCPETYESNEMFLSSAAHLSSLSPDTEYLNYSNGAYQTNNQLLYPVSDQVSSQAVPNQVSPMLHSNVSFRSPCPPTCLASHRSDNFSSYGSFNHQSLSHQINPVNHSLGHLEPSTNLPLNPMYQPADQANLSMCRLNCPINQLTCEEKLRHTCRSHQQCADHHQIDYRVDCNLHRGCCRSTSPKVCNPKVCGSKFCGNICRTMSCTNELFEQNLITSSCCAGHDCGSRCSAYSRNSCCHNCYPQHCDHNCGDHRNASHRYLHQAGPEVCQPRNCQCLPSNLIASQLNSSVDFTAVCPNRSTNCEMQKTSTKKDLFETDSGIATRCNSTANGSLEIE